MVRWNSQGVEGNTLLSLFEDHLKDKTTGADLKRQDSEYIHDNVWNKNQIFKKWTHKRFYVTYRRLEREYIVNKGLSEKRAGK